MAFAVLSLSKVGFPVFSSITQPPNAVRKGTKKKGSR